MIVQCTNCGVSVERHPSELRKVRNSFCSMSCAAKFNNKTAIKRPLVNTCKDCSTVIRSNASYCKQCFDGSLIQNRTIASVIETRKNDANRFTGIRTHARKKLIEHDPIRKCICCEYDKHVEVCHVRDIADFPIDTLVSEVNNIDNLVWMCRNHHWEFDHDLMSTEDKLKIVRARYDLATKGL